MFGFLLAFMLYHSSTVSYFHFVARYLLCLTLLPYVQWLDCSGNSPDLNPMENVRSRLKRALAQRRPSNKQQLI